MPWKAVEIGDDIVELPPAKVQVGRRRGGAASLPCLDSSMIWQLVHQRAASPWPTSASLAAQIGDAATTDKMKSAHGGSHGCHDVSNLQRALVVHL